MILNDVLGAGDGGRELGATSSIIYLNHNLDHPLLQQLN